MLSNQLRPSITQADLFYKYTWRAVGDDNALLRGHPDSDLLNRHEGYEVLRFLMRLLHEGWDKPQVLRAERLLHKAPGNLRSHAHLKAWIVENWNTSV